MNRIGILDGYGDYGYLGAAPKKGRKKKGKMSRSKKAVAARKRFAKASKSCAKRRSGSFQNCMKKKYRKKGRK